MVGLAVGTVCVSIAHRWASRRQWRLRLPEFIDSHCRGDAALYRWSLTLLLLGFIPLLATGVFNPAQLIAALLRGRNFHGGSAVGEIYSAGTYFAFFNAFSNLVPFGVAAAALLFWRKKYSPSLFALVAFFAFAMFATGTRSTTAALLAPLVLVPRYFGNRKIFRRVAVVGAIAVFVVSAMQLAYRAIGFEHASIARAVSRANPLQVFDATQLAWTGQAVVDYGPKFHYLHGQSYLAVAVNPVPRIFWPTKPEGYSDVNARNLGYGKGTTVTSGWLGEAYANFGWAGIPIVGLVAGVLMGILDVFVMRSGPLALAVLLPLQLRWIIWVRGDSVFSFDPWLFGFIILVVILAVAGPARDPGWQRQLATDAAA
jgi:oligosaccharide repeat unit polymerase